MGPIPFHTANSVERVQIPMSIKSQRPLTLSTQKITLLGVQADTVPIPRSARVQPAYRLSYYLDRLICVLRTWIPLVARLYSAPGCLALNLGLGVGSPQSNPMKGSLLKLWMRTARVLVGSVNS